MPGRFWARGMQQLGPRPDEYATLLSIGNLRMAGWDGCSNPPNSLLIRHRASNRLGWLRRREKAFLACFAVQKAVKKRACQHPVLELSLYA
jgi:hypothetical protein